MESVAVYAASAMAGNCVIRSVLGGVLPLAGPASEDPPISFLSCQYRFPTFEILIWFHVVFMSQLMLRGHIALFSNAKDKADTESI